MSPNVTIQEGALFIADAHDNEKRVFFWDFLLFIKDNPPPQLFLMGDMFDLLVGDVSYGVKKYQPYISLLEEIATRCEVYYFEGNHDFNLSKLFLHVKIFPIDQQPLLATLPNGQTIALLHGDKYGDRLHRCYTRLIRNTSVLKGLNALDILLGRGISRAIEANQRKKKLCAPIATFETLIENKLRRYPQTSFIAEGHYHQNRQFTFNSLTYVNFSSFACNQSYFSVQSLPKTHFAPMQFRSCPTT